MAAENPSDPVFEDPLETVVAYSPAESQIYLGSPSLVLDPDGGIIASHDQFGPKSPYDAFGRECATCVCRSDDGGASWTSTASIRGAFWASLFSSEESVYLLGCSAHYGDIVIRRLVGKSGWTEPRDGGTGLLFAGGPGTTPPNYHCAPVPVLEHNGRLWRAFEDNFSGQWAYFDSTVISASFDSDLLKASSWRMTNKLRYDRDLDPPEFSPELAGWLEGNVVASPGGGVWNVLRVHSVPTANWAAVTKVSADGKALRFDPSTGFIRFPGGMSKFTIRFDPQTRRYLTISNEVRNLNNPWQRNVLVLASSSDLLHWRTDRTLMYSYEDERLVHKQCKTGFQYADWIFDGEDILILVRTAFQGAHNFHDANHITFHRLEGYVDFVKTGEDHAVHVR